MEIGHGEFVSQREAARRFHVSARTLRTRVRQGELMTYRDPLDSRAQLLRVSDLEQLRRIQAAPAVHYRAENAA